MQQQSDIPPSSYYQNPYYPNPVSEPPMPIPGATSGPYASAPPMSYSPSDYSNFHPDQAANPNPHYSYPQPYHQNQNQAPFSYNYANPNPNPEPNYDSQFSQNSYSYAPSSLPYQQSAFESYEGGQEVFGDTGVYKYNGGGNVVRSSGSGGGGGGVGNVGRLPGSGGGGGVLFDDYGRPIASAGNAKNDFVNEFSKIKIVKASPKVEDSQDAANGVQKFRVKVLSEGFGQTDIDVLCQIGLDGIRILDPSTSRMLKIYPLDMITEWEVLDSYIFAFWAKTSVDPEPKRIRLKSTSYTTNNILDTVTAASIQSKEIGSSSNPSDTSNGNEQSVEKRKGFDWKNLIKPVNEEKDHWVPDEVATKCTGCRSDFSAFNRKHHCRNCGDIFCDKCTQGRIALTADENAQQVRVCDGCMAEVTQRLSIKNTTRNNAALQSHEDLARKLQEEMDKKRKPGLKSETSSTRMREVECPTCTVHLQVKVPSSGSETIECSVCQHPFLISAH